MNAVLQKLHDEHLQRRARISGAPVPAAIMRSSSAPPKKAPKAPKIDYVVPRSVWAPLTTYDRHVVAYERALLAEMDRDKIAATVSTIIAASAHYFDVKATEMKTIRAGGFRLRARHIAMYIARTRSKLSYPKIARNFGGRNHTTIIYAVRRIEALMHLDEYITDVAAIMTEIDLRTIRQDRQGTAP